MAYKRGRLPARFVDAKKRKLSEQYQVKHLSKHVRKHELRPCSTVVILEITIDLGGVCVSQSGEPGGLHLQDA